MSDKTRKIIYLGSTIAFSLSMLLAVGFYFFKHDYVTGYFEMIGFPGWLVYPLGVVKIMGIIGMWNRNYPTIREWAYAGYFYNCVLAFFGNYLCPTGEFALAALVAIALLVVSYIFQPDSKVLKG